MRAPGDAIVALRSLSRRYRGLFAGLGDDESPDDLAHRPGADGWSALDHVVSATASLTTIGRALERTLVEAEPVVQPAEVVPDAGATPPKPGGSVDERLAELAWEADALAERATHVSAAEWGRSARLADGSGEVHALELLWRAVDAAILHLRGAELVLREVRGRPA